MKIKVGEEFKTMSYGSCIVIEYINAKNVVVRFEDGFETTCQAGDLRKGHVRNPYYPTVCGVGFFGEGGCTSRSHKRIYQVWVDMFCRCYDETTKLNQPTYKDCTVHEDWYNFQNFVRDYEQMIGFDKDWQLDKDLLFEGNTIYSKETCCLLPQEINKALIYKSKNGLLPGVTFGELRKTPFIARVHIDGKEVHLGCFDSEIQAFLVYKKAKEDHIKKLAELHRPALDSVVYEALTTWEVV